VPRLHDIGRSGWWVGAAILGEIAVIAAAFAFLPLEGVPIVLGIYGLLAIVWLVVLGIIPGESTANRFGKPTAPGLSFGRPAAEDRRPARVAPHEDRDDQEERREDQQGDPGDDDVERPHRDVGGARRVGLARGDPAGARQVQDAVFLQYAV